MLARRTRDDQGQPERERCIEIRRDVFIEEQQIAKELEMDDLDPDCTHFLAWTGSDREAAKAVGTARLWIDAEGVAKAQRVAVLAAVRGVGIGRILMRAVEEETRSRGIDSLILGAQHTAIPFYESIGYIAYGEGFDDAGIPHRMMRCVLDVP